MTPKLSIRAFSNDQFILDKVHYSNQYRLKGYQDGDKKPTIVDLGAHCGYFTFAAMSLGAMKIYSFEPSIENYRMLVENTKEMDPSKVLTYQVGVDSYLDILQLYKPRIVDKSFYDFANLQDEGDDAASEDIICLSIDQILSKIIREEEVSILKVSLGGGEIRNILGSKNIPNRVHSIVLETVDNVINIDSFIKEMEARGFSHSAFSKIKDEESYIILLSKDILSKTFNVDIT